MTLRNLDPISLASLTGPLTAEHLLGPLGEEHELWDGALLARSPSGGAAEAVAATLVRRIGQHVYERRLGRMFTSSQGFVLSRGPDRVLAPDVAYVSFVRLPEVPRDRFIEGPPDFAVEVRSPAQTWSEVAEKCGIWIAHRVRVVWGVDPIDRVVAVFRPLSGGSEHRSGACSADPAVPELSLDVEDVFEEV